MDWHTSPPRAADSLSGCHDNRHKLVSQTVATAAIEQSSSNGEMICCYCNHARLCACVCRKHFTQLHATNAKV